MNKNTLMLLALAASLTACAGETGKKLDQKVEQASDVQSTHDVYQEARKLTRKTPGLSPDQKQKLDALQQQVHEKLAKINGESLKLRSILAKDVLSDNPDQKEITAVKRRMRKLSRERLNTLFDATDQTNEILGRNDLIREASDVQFLEQDFNYW